MDKLDQIGIKRSNLLRFWAALEGKATITRQELAEKTGLSLMSITSMVNELVDRNALTVTAPLSGPDARRAAGRRAEVITVNKYDLVWLLIDLTGRRFTLCALTMDQQPLYISPPWAYDEKKSYEENVDLFLRRGRKYVDSELKGHEMMGVGVVVSGPYDVAEDRARSERVLELNEIRIKETLRYELGLYDYYVDETAKFAVRACFRAAPDQDSELTYYLYVGESVSGAISHKGNVLRGQNAMAGNAGTLRGADGEAYGAALSIRAFARALKIPGAEAMDDDALFEAVQSAAQKEPDRYERALEPFADNVAALLATVTRVIDPKMIVLDCRYAQLSAKYFPRVTDALQAALGDQFGTLPRLLPAMSERLSIVSGMFQALLKQWLYKIA